MDRTTRIHGGRAGAQRTEEHPAPHSARVLCVAGRFAGGVFFARYRNYQQLNETLRSLMEKGVAIPPELLTPKTRMAPGISDFRKGLLLVWSGIGAMFLLGIILNGSRAWSLGLIPIFTGLAYLVMWKLERRKETA